MLSVNLPLGLISLAGLAMIVLAASRGWQGWLNLKLRELERGGAPEIEGGAQSGAARIELADLRERIRKLEAIAAGVDL